MADAMTAAVLAQLPAYRDLPGRDAFRAGLAETVMQFLDMAATGATELSVEARARLRAVSAQRAGQGLTVDDVLRSLQISMQSGWGYLARRLAAATGGADAVVAMADLAVVLVRFVAAVQAELVEGFHAGRSLHDRRRADVLDDLFAGSFSDEKELLDRAQAVGLDLAGEHSLILLVSPGAAADVSLIGRTITEVLPGALAAAMTAQHPPHLALLLSCLPSVTEDSARNQLEALARQHGVTALVGSWRVQTGGVPGAYREALDSTAIAMAAQPGGVVTLDELLPDRCMQSMPDLLLRALVHRTLRSVLRQPELIETLWELHAHESQTATAAALGVHIHTIRRRCDRIRELTGLDVDRPADRFRVDLALHALRHLDLRRPSGDVFSRSRGTSEPTGGTSEPLSHRPNAVYLPEQSAPVRSDRPRQRPPMTFPPRPT